jgi:DNA-binding XRE family transcriptional regulator
MLKIRLVNGVSRRGFLMYELSQDDLAQALEMSRLTIRKLEDGKMLP